MVKIADFDEQQAMEALAILAAAGAPVPAVSWAESYDDFLLYLEDCGITADNLPTWPPGAAVMVIAQLPNFWLQRLSRAEARKRARFVATGKNRLEAVPLAELAGPTWERLQVVGIDADKFRAAQLARPWERV
jgi:hypothetical protein